MATEICPNGVSNPLPKIPASWFDFSLENDDLKIRKPYQPKAIECPLSCVFLGAGEALSYLQNRCLPGRSQTARQVVVT